MGNRQRIHSSHQKSQQPQNTGRLNSSPVLQAKKAKKAVMPEWQPSTENWQTNLQDPLGGMFGNARVAPVQAKLTIGEVGDKYEQEADRVAADVVERINTPKTEEIQPDRDNQGQLPESDRLQLKPDLQLQNAIAGESVSSEFESSLQQAKGGGQPLNTGLQETMGTAMGADFSSVKVHTDSASHQLNESIQAKAFTTGQHIFFKQGKYAPENREGQGLIAHELTHVVQQGGANVQRQIDGEGIEVTPQSISIARQPVPQIQALFTSKQLIAMGGKPKDNILFVGMSERYKAIIAKLNEYHAYVQDTEKAISDSDFDNQELELHFLLNDIKSNCSRYLGAHKDDVNQKRYEAVLKIHNEVDGEKAAITALKPQKNTLDGVKWSDALHNGMYGESGGLTIPDDATIIRKEPALEGKFKSNANIYESADLSDDGNTVIATANKGDLCMEREVPGVEGVRHVQPYTIKKEDDDDKKGKPQFVTEKTGYVPAGKVKQGKYVHEDVASDVPIFDGVPDMEDVRQGAIGDCYLMAAVASIVRTDPEFIYSMMKDNGSGKVTVRLYSGGLPQYIELKKNVVSKGRRSRGALWVNFIEKAYTVTAVRSESYYEMEGGQMSDAWEALTGQNANKVDITEQGGFENKNNYSFWEQANIGDGIDTKGAYELMLTVPKLRAKRLPASEPYRITGGDETEALELIDWALNSANLPLIKKFRQAAAAKNLEAFLPVIDDLNEVSDLDEGIKLKIVDSIKLVYPGTEAGSYSTGQEDVFAAIKNALDAGQYVGASTSPKLPEPSQGEGHSGGESKARGLAGNHAYSIIGYSEEDSLKFLKLRNPWGSYGVEYKRDEEDKVQIDDTQTPVREDDEDKLNKNTGTFDLELAEFLRYYQDVHFGNRVVST